MPVHRGNLAGMAKLHFWPGRTYDILDYVLPRAFPGRSRVNIEKILTQSDQLRVRDTLTRLSSRLNRPSLLSLSDLLDEWSKFVVAVKQGYQWSMESYTRDLAVRDLIEEVSEGLSMDGRRLVEISIKDVDDDFIEATHDPDQPDETDSARLEIAWWQFRIPKKPQGKLLDDLQRMGLKMYGLPSESPPANSPEPLQGIQSPTDSSEPLQDIPSPPDYKAPPELTS
jgi:hypothetical protein